MNANWEEKHLSAGKVQDCKSESVGNAFKKALEEAKASQPEERAWRVDTDSHDGKDYVGAKVYKSEGGSTFAVTKDGDIISVCKKIGDSTTTGGELLEKAVKVGGKKLDSFDGNFGFYLRNGFEPVSWTAFDENYAPKGWVKDRNDPEPVVFFKYTGKKYSEQSKDLSKDFWEIKKAQFYKKVKMSKDYDTAMSIRDKSINDKK